MTRCCYSCRCCCDFKLHEWPSRSPGCNAGLRENARFRFLGGAFMAVLFLLLGCCSPAARPALRRTLKRYVCNDTEKTPANFIYHFHPQPALHGAGAAGGQGPVAPPPPPPSLPPSLPSARARTISDSDKARHFHRTSPSQPSLRNRPVWSRSFARNRLFSCPRILSEVGGRVRPNSFAPMGAGAKAPRSDAKSRPCEAKRNRARARRSETAPMRSEAKPRPCEAKRNRARARRSGTAPVRGEVEPRP